MFDVEDFYKEVGEFLSNYKKTIIYKETYIYEGKSFDRNNEALDSWYHNNYERGY